MTAGQLALHLALVPGAVMASAKEDFIDPPSFTFPQPDSPEQIIKAYEESIATVRRLVLTLDDASMASTWRIMDGDIELLAVSRETFVRDIMFNHWYQHRGQFSVYLRLLGQPVLASWGPSADELPI